MSDRYPIDEFFKDRFGNHEPDLPADAWEKLQAARSRQKHRRALPWWRRLAWALLLLLGLSTALLLWLKPGRTNVAESTALANPHNEHSARQAENRVTAAPPRARATPSTPESAQQVDASMAVSEGASIRPATGSVATSEAKNSKGLAITSSEQQASAGGINSFNAQSAKSTAGIQRSNEAVPSLAQASMRSNRTQKRQHANTVLKAKTAAGTWNEIDPTVKAIDVTITNATTISDGEEAEVEATAIGQRNRITFVKPLPVMRLGTMENAPISSRKYPPCPALERDAAANKQYLEWYVGPDLGLKTQSDTGNSAYLQKRRESTRFLWAFSAGFRYTRVFQNGVSFRTGINFSQITERFRWVQANYVQVNYSIDPTSGDTTGITTTRGTRYKTTYNRFRSIDVPLLLGYETGFGRFKLNAHAGALVNVYGWQRGEVLDTALRPVSITTGKGSPLYQYRTNLGIGLTGGVSFYYGLNDNWQILAEPYFRYNLTPMSREGLTYREKYNVIGLRIGLRRNLW